MEQSESKEIHQLHREIAVLRGLCILAIILPCILAASEWPAPSAAFAKFNKLSADQIGVASAGKYRIRMMMFGGQPSLIFWDEHEQVRMTIGLAEMDAHGNVMDQHRDIIAAKHRGTGDLLLASPGVRIFDPEGVLIESYPLPITGE